MATADTHLGAREGAVLGAEAPALEPSVVIPCLNEADVTWRFDPGG